MAETFVIAQGGGPTAVINQTLAGIVTEAKRRHPGCRVLGSLHGVRGIRDNRLIDLAAVPQPELTRLANTPSAALGSTRDKPDEAYCEKVLKGLREIGATAFVYVGGNDTAGTQQILTEAAASDIAFVHAPKTIDNDLAENDHTPGFISAAEFVAAGFLSIDLDFRALPGIYVGIVMGRHAGFLTAASAAWRLDEASGPHLVYVPERAFDPQRFVDDVRATLHHHGRCVVAMSEGISDEEGTTMVQSLVPVEMLERDAHGNIKLSGGDLGQAIERLLSDAIPGTRKRVDTFGYLPRCNLSTASETDRKEAFEAGVFAVEAAERGGGSVALRYENRATKMALVPLGAVAGKTRTMPDNFLHRDYNHLSPEAHAYFERLVPRKAEMGKPFV